MEVVGEQKNPRFPLKLIVEMGNQQSNATMSSSPSSSGNFAAGDNAAASNSQPASQCPMKSSRPSVEPAGNASNQQGTKEGDAVCPVKQVYKNQSQYNVSIKSPQYSPF